MKFGERFYFVLLCFCLLVYFLKKNIMSTATGIRKGERRHERAASKWFEYEKLYLFLTSSWATNSYKKLIGKILTGMRVAIIILFSQSFTLLTTYYILVTLKMSNIYTHFGAHEWLIIIQLSVFFFFFTRMELYTGMNKQRQKSRLDFTFYNNKRKN